MSTLTSIFGMLPLLLLPGAGSVIYRGLAGVIVGGMCQHRVHPGAAALPAAHGEHQGDNVAGAGETHQRTAWSPPPEPYTGNHNMKYFGALVLQWRVWRLCGTALGATEPPAIVEVVAEVGRSSGMA